MKFDKIGYCFQLTPDIDVMREPLAAMGEGPSWWRTFHASEPCGERPEGEFAGFAEIGGHPGSFASDAKGLGPMALIPSAASMSRLRFNHHLALGETWHA